MKKNLTKKIVGCALSVLFVTSLVSGMFAQASSPTVEESALLEAAQPVLSAYEAHYVLQNPRITNPSDVFEENGTQYVTFFLTFDATLKYDNALDLPKVKGIAQALNLEEAQSVEDFSQKLHTEEALTAIGTDVQEMLLANPAASVRDVPGTAGKVLENLDAFVTELQDTYIGTSSEFNIDMRATVDRQGNVLKLEYSVFDDYSDDIASVIPASTERMVQAGEDHILETIDLALS